MRGRNGNLSTRAQLATRILILATFASLAACGSGGDSSTNVASDSGNDFHIDSRGRLAITEAEVAAVRILDLDDNRIVGEIKTANPPSQLYASPSRRYAVAVQRMQDRVEFIDGGLWQEDHGDHLHDYEAAPKAMDYVLEGARPTHYEVHDGIAALFMDGSTDDARPAAVVTFSDADIARGGVSASTTLERPMHGTAEPRGDWMLTTWRDPQATSTLPVQVELHRRSGDGFAFVQRFDEPCPSLHGSFSNDGHTVFGCADGVLVITQQGDAFTASKIANPAGLPPGTRVGTVIGHHALSKLVGFAGRDLVFEIDPQALTMTPIDWASGRQRMAHAMDADGAHLLLVDDLGVLHLLEASAAWRVKASVPVTGAIGADDPRPMIEPSQKDDAVFVTDPQGNRVVEVRTTDGGIAGQIPLSFRPAAITWLGVAGAHEHD